MAIAQTTSADRQTASPERPAPGTIKKTRNRKRRMPVFLKWLIPVVAVAAIGGGILLWRLQSTASTAQASTIYLPVTVGDLDITVQSNGKVQATREQAVTYETTGNVLEVLVKSGDTVKAGQPLVRLTDADQRQAVTDAEAALNTAQAKLDDLKKGPTDAEVASAKAEVQSAQANLDSVKAGATAKDIADARADLRLAEANLASVKAGATTKEMADAQADLKTAQAAYASVKAGATPKDIADAQADLKTAKADYESVKAGPTAKEIADAQADVTAAQAKYDALVAPPSSSDLKQAQSALDAAKTKLATLKAGPTSAELSKAQLAVTQAQADLKNTQNDYAVSKQEKELALSKASRDLQTAQRSYSSAATKVIDQYGELPTDPTDPTFSNYWTAYNTLKDAEAAVAQAETTLDSVRQKEIQDAAQAQAKLDDAEKQLADVQAGATADELASAQLDVDKAQAALAALLAGPTKDELASAQAAVTKAKTTLDQLKAGPTADELAKAEADVVKAQTSLDNLKAGPTPEELAKSEADVIKAQTTLDKLKAGSTADEIVSAQTTVDKARNKLNDLLAGATPDQIASANATLAQKQASLDSLLQPASDSEIAAAEQTMQTAQKNLADARTELSRTTLLAPFSGVVGSVSAEANAKISVGGEALTIYDAAGMHVELAVNESDIDKIKEGQPSVITLDALPGEAITGTVSSVSNASVTNQDVVTYQVDVQFSPGDLAVKTGMSANATITVESHQGVIQVPTRAIKTVGRNKTVEVLYGDTKTPVAVTVTTGATNSQMTEITGCVETNNQCLREGDQLAVTIAASTTTGTNSNGGAVINVGGFGGSLPAGGGQFPGGTTRQGR